MGAQVSRNDYEWVSTDEPHAIRRALILAKYPEIKLLMRVDPNFKWKILLMVFTQILSFYLLRNTTSFWVLFVIGYSFNGVINHWLMLSIHEIAHNQVFGPSRPLHNKLFGIIANLPMGFPFSISYKEYHSEHHRYLGVDHLDPDTPTRLEARIFKTTFRKIIWFILQGFFYLLRPVLTRPKPLTLLHFTNIVIQLSFDVIIGQTMGWHLVLYMIGISFVTLGLHPMSGHLIAEHYIMFTKNKESVEKYQKEHPLENGVNINNGEMIVPDTSSYYGPLNAIILNVGYHVEHHDFPSIPAKLLPEVRKIAPEFYDSLYSHNSLIYVTWKYITDPNMGPYARVKRPQKWDKLKNILKNT